MAAGVALNFDAGHGLGFFWKFDYRRRTKLYSNGQSIYYKTKWLQPQWKG